MRTPRSTPDHGPSGAEQAAPGAQQAGPHGPTAPPVRGRRAHAGPPAHEPPDPTPWDRTHLPPAEEQPAAAPQAPQTRMPRQLRLRPKSVRAKVICVLMVPVVSLIGLWGYATVTTAQDISRLRQLERVDTQVRAPLAATVAALQDERRAAARYLAAPDGTRADDLDREAGDTDRAARRLRLDKEHTVAEGEDLPKDVSVRMSAFVKDVGELRGLRERIRDRGVPWSEAYAAYTDSVERAFAVSGALSGIQDPELASDARVLVEFARAGEMLSREDALLTAGQLDKSLGAKEHRQFIGAVESRRQLEGSAVPDLRSDERGQWQEFAGSGAYREVRALEDKVAAAPPGRGAGTAVSASDWDTVFGDVLSSYRDVQTDAATAAAARNDPFTRGVLTPAGAAVILGLIAVAAALIISVRIGRGLVVELVSLRNTALELARRKLPHAMRRLRAGQEIDVDAEAPVEVHGDDEIAQVSEALSTVHRAALTAAVERAELASGISGVFVNLARRSQVLVHRQLALLDSMERRADDPNELEDLFRLDHLTTRMRRHAESLIILSGSAPGRAWRMPVPLQNVVRAAVSEVEDYARIEVRSLPEASVVGAAVADLTHLLAELVENATQFSPPHTKVRIYGEQVGNGYVLEIEDRGLGMGKETLDAANERIRQSEALDLFDSDRLGLFVVSRLAARHGIKVSLRASPYGGTTVVVLLPTPLLQAGVPEPGKGASGPAQQPAGLTARAERMPESVMAGGPLGGGPELPSLGSRDDVVQLRIGRNGDGPAGPPRPPGPPGTPPDRSDTRTHHPQPFVPPPQGGGPDPAQADGAGADGPPPGGADEALPKRVRQASLAPQLREAPEKEETAPRRPRPDSGPAPRDRSPEQARARMAAYRSGWVRGGGLTAGRTGESRAGSKSSEGDEG
ncbi:nitrate- and nitrite sensing domain-containing protein [Streptomyces boninensis]|uniref:sensor histidine kinase n=1 Tax=Streptomyces boninensis TaxID=2039455 RepID=UPI003B2118E6